MPQFVIGIGSQRAGSTLLHKVLDQCTDVFMHPVKELHYYDTLFKVRDEKVLKEFSKRQLDRELERLIEAKGFGYIDKKYKSFIRTNKILRDTPVEDVEYVDLYRPSIMGNDFIGEITPEYMILPEEGVAKMSADLGKNAKIILISRDPVERFISAFKLLKNYGNPEYESHNFEEELKDSLLTMPSWIEQQKQLNDYKAALDVFSKYFDDILFLSFENMLENPSHLKSQLESFLNVDICDNCFKEVFTGKTNSLGDTANVSPELQQKLKELFAKEKQFLVEEFG